jgi:cbb3-type cytochrome oxidase cytochrome c subunit
MNHGPLIFLGVLVTFVASWWGLVFAPQVQIGSQQNAATDTGIYPVRRAGVAERGHQVYVANGCVHCHSQQVRQEGYTFDVVLTAGGTNTNTVIRMLGQIAPDVDAAKLFANASDTDPQPVLKNVPQRVADDAQAQLKKAGASAQTVFIPTGVDIGRRWGSRRSVAADYLYDSPVQVGHSRLGPDLANYGKRAPNVALILAHLYDPHSVMPGSLMPAHRYLFETKPVGKRPSPNALKLTGKAAPKEGFEVVPTEDALHLVSYLQSLRSDFLLFEAPMTLVAPPTTDAGTNSPATNAPANTAK